jgi:hypothetical protein
MKLANLVFSCLWLSLSFLTSPPVMADTDAFQRYFLFKNDLSHTIYPVIQAPNDSNCNQSGFPGGSVLRIIVNSSQAVDGIPPGGKVRVAIPKDKPCAKGGFYDASRLYVLLANVVDFENTFPKNDDKRTTPIDVSKWGILCSNPDTSQSLPGACWAGLAKADYGHDAPGQLLEYTIISQNPLTGDKFPDSQGGANNKTGIPFLDFDVSYVDDAYLPVAMAVSDTGATQFMGSTIAKPDVTDPYKTFNDRLHAFVNETKWSRYAAYSDLVWNANKNTFQKLVPDQTDRLPSANILITDSRTGGTSNFYTPLANGYSTKCNAGDFKNLNTPNRQCHIALPGNTDCCPDPVNGFQGCCDIRPYLIENTLGQYTGTNEKVQDETKRGYTNTTLTDITARWTKWNDDKINCQTPPVSPIADNKGFCTAFGKTLKYVWQQFKTTDAKAKTPVCASITNQDKANQCLVQQIIGYDIKSGYDANKCKKCPSENVNECPTACVQEVQRNESVQALQRGLPWTPANDDPNKCNVCPGDNCPSSCVIPAVPTSKKLYHRNKFLHFWAPYNSPYNLNPFARLVHSEDDGLAAPGAYSFSIDDFYGNFGGQGSTMIVDVGGTTELPNKEPYDPFKQYAVGVPPGYYRGTVCGRPFELPQLIAGKRGFSVPFDFWKDGKPIDSCEVVLKDQSGQSVSFLLKQVTYQIADAHTGKPETVSGLSGVWANRPSSRISNPDPYCLAHSSKPLANDGKCNANLSPKGNTQDYVGVSDDACKSTDALNATCGKPLIVLNPPALCNVCGDGSCQKVCPK